MGEKLATEIMHELKASADRWFKAFVLMLILEALTIGTFILYCSLPTEESSVVTQEGDQLDSSTMTQTIEK